MKRIIKTVLTSIFARRTKHQLSRSFTFNQKRVKKLLYFKRALDKVVDLEGAVVECGVGEAGVFRMLALLLQEEGRNRVLWGFDSFEGYPEPTGEDQGTRDPKKGEGAIMSVNDLKEVLADLEINIPVKIVKGFFEETLPKTKVPPIALLHLDVNLYGSYKTCLENLFPKVVTGGIVLFDEYAGGKDLLKWPGAKKAIDEYFAGKSYKIQQDPWCGKYFLMKDK